MEMGLKFMGINPFLRRKSGMKHIALIALGEKTSAVTSCTDCWAIVSTSATIMQRAICPNGSRRILPFLRAALPIRRPIRICQMACPI